MKHGIQDTILHLNSYLAVNGPRHLRAVLPVLLFTISMLTWGLMKVFFLVLSTSCLLLVAAVLLS